MTSQEGGAERRSFGERVRIGKIEGRSLAVGQGSEKLYIGNSLMGGPPCKRQAAYVKGLPIDEALKWQHAFSKSARGRCVCRRVHGVHLQGGGSAAIWHGGGRGSPPHARPAQHRLPGSHAGGTPPPPLTLQTLGCCLVEKKAGSLRVLRSTDLQVVWRHHTAMVVSVNGGGGGGSSLVAGWTRKGCNSPGVAENVSVTASRNPASYRVGMST